MKDFSLSAHYDQLWESSLAHISCKGFEYDPLIDSPLDKRFGITLLIRPSQKVNEAIQNVLSEIKLIAPAHHYCPSSDIHVTVMPIISCYEGFELAQIDPQAYIDLLQGCLTDLPPFSIDFKGLTASPSCIIVKGFPLSNTLESARNRLREAFKNSALEQSLDKRYPLQTAHSTVVRFKQPVQRQASVLKKLEKYQDYNFGSFEVRELKLVYNDWYQRQERVERLFTFKLAEK